MGGGCALGGAAAGGGEGSARNERCPRQAGCAGGGGQAGASRMDGQKGQHCLVNVVCGLRNCRLSCPPCALCLPAPHPLFKPKPCNPALPPPPVPPPLDAPNPSPAACAARAWRPSRRPGQPRCSGAGGPAERRAAGGWGGGWGPRVALQHALHTGMAREAHAPLSHACHLWLLQGVFTDVCSPTGLISRCVGPAHCAHLPACRPAE